MWETIRGISLVAILSLFAIAYIENSSDLCNRQVHFPWSKKKDKSEEDKDVESKVVESDDTESEEDATEK